VAQVYYMYRTIAAAALAATILASLIIRYYTIIIIIIPIHLLVSPLYCTIALPTVYYLPLRRRRSRHYIIFYFLVPRYTHIMRIIYIYIHIFYFRTYIFVQMAVRRGKTSITYINMMRILL